MKKKEYSYFAGCMVMLISIVCSWLFFSIIGWVFSDHLSYYDVIRHDGQLVAVLFLYWWCPGILILADMYDWGNS